MTVPRKVVLALIVKGFENTQSPVRVPENLRSKAKALCRDGFLSEADGVNHFVPTPLGRLMAEDIPDA